LGFLQSIHDWAARNPEWFAAICSTITLVCGAVWSAFVSSLPAPTAQSTPKYQFWFKFFNTLAANLARAKSTAVENSPNFQDAVNKINKQQPEEKPVVVVEPPKQ
jgi:hypothetical protein